MAYRVLLMDDEPAICEISGILLKTGYEPVIAVSGGGPTSIKTTG